MVRRVAVVTGANKGIGFEIVKGLCEYFDGDVYLTARDPELGRAAVRKLKSLGFNPIFRKLNVKDQDTVNAFKDYVITRHGHIDLLVNNAAISFPEDSNLPYEWTAEETIKVNYFGTLRVCEALFPILRQNAKVVNMTSDTGHLSSLSEQSLRDKFRDENLTVEGLSQLMRDYVTAAEQDDYYDNGWGINDYNVTKLAITALTFIHQRLFDAEVPYRNISVNAVNPGFASTYINGFTGLMTPAQGAMCPLYACLEATCKGKFIWYDRTIVDWDKPLPPRVTYDEVTTGPQMYEM